MSSEKILVEACVENITSAQNAIIGGAGRLELCSLLKDGGLTPFDDFVIAVKNMFPNIPAYAMVRSNPSIDFCYSSYDIATMKEQIEMLKRFGVQGFVFGALNSNGRINTDQCREIIEAAKPLPVTFHRAFDVATGDPLEDMEKIISLGFERILTSGRKMSAASAEACELIDRMISKAGERIIIMPGAGINPNNVQNLIQLKPKEIHGSFQFPLKSIDEDYRTSEDIVSKIVALCNPK